MSVIREKSNMVEGLTICTSAKRDGVVGYRSPIKKVAAYCRVSTDLEIQQSSLELQMSSYNRIIQEHPGWELAGIYADQGLSGTSAEKRVEFQQMIEDAKAGKIDVILAKSISRFARNTYDTLGYTRDLKEIGVSVYFEKEKIDTSGISSELLLTVFAAFAQEESHSISENTKRGIRNRFKLGQPRYTKIMGYDNDWELNEDAEIVRAIFDLAFDGYSKREIETILNENNIKTPNNKEKWCCESVLGILRNEKYIGDVHMQKTYTGNFLIHDKVYNREATVDSYYREDHHEGIVDRELFDALAFETCLKRGYYGAEQTPYFGMLRCPTCGRAMVKIPGIYTEKRDIWICPGDGVEGRLLNRSCCEKVPVFSTELDKTITKAVLEMEPEPGFDEAIERLKDLVLRNGQPSYCRLIPLIEKMYMESADTLVVHWKMGWTGKYQIGEAVDVDTTWAGIAKAYVGNETMDGKEIYRVLHPLRKKEIRDRVDGKTAV